MNPSFWTLPKFLIGLAALALVGVGIWAYLGGSDDANPVQHTVDAALVERRAGCKVPLTGLLQRDASGAWLVSWDEIRTHLSTLVVEADQGEKNHILKPVDRREVRASIASIAGTDVMDESESLIALQCGRVIARIESDGDHDATKILTGTNYLVLARTLPVASRSSAWAFVILNPTKDSRVSLDHFKYTPHVTDKPLSAAVLDFRGHGRLAPRLSAAAMNCVNNVPSWKACFIDPGVRSASPGSAGYHGLGTSGTVFWQGGLGSQPWVPCPLYGCCCGGDACHGDG